MKLNYIIHEAFDKNLAAKIANQLDITTDRLKEIVVAVDDPNMTNGVWVLKQIKQLADIGVRTQKRLKRVLDKFKRVQDRLAEKNIGKYDLESLETAVSAFAEQEEEPEIHPINQNGVQLLEHIGSGDDQYYIYVFYDAEALAKWSRGGAAEVKNDNSQPVWCTRAISNARKYLVDSPQIMIFKNNKPTTLFAFDKSQVKNSGNTDETRPALLKLIDHTINTYGSRIKAERMNYLPPFDLILAKCEQDPANCIPNKLSETEINALLDDIEKTVKKYVPAVVKATGKKFPRWPLFEQILSNAVSLVPRAEGGYIEPATLLVSYYQLNEQGYLPLDRYFDMLYNYYPPMAITGYIKFIRVLKEEAGSAKAFDDANTDRIAKFEKMIHSFFVDDPETVASYFDEAESDEEITALIDAVKAAAGYSVSREGFERFDQWFFGFPIPVKIKNNIHMLERWNSAKSELRQKYGTIVTAKFHITSPDTDEALWWYEFNYKSQFDEYTINARIDSTAMYRNATLTTPDGEITQLTTSDNVLEDFEHDRHVIQDEVADANGGDLPWEQTSQGTLSYQVKIKKTVNKNRSGDFSFVYEILQ